MFVLDPKNGVTFSETSNRTKVEQEKNSNQKYTGVGYIPDYDGYISWTGEPVIVRYGHEVNGDFK